MERDGGFVHRPPILDGSNYDYWKHQMVAFLKSLDNKAWKAVLTGWAHPVITKEREAITDKKPEEQCPVHHQTHYQARPKHHRPVNKKQWVPKTNVTSLIAHISFRVSAKEDWYFDSGCSRHMTGNKDLLTGLHPHAISYVTFGDGAKGEIKGIGKLDCPGVPELDNVLLVKGLTANLISISQLCDQGLDVNFTKTEYKDVTPMVEHVASHMQTEVGKNFVGLELQVKQIEGSMCLSQSKYAKNNVKKIGMESERTPSPLKDENVVCAIYQAEYIAAGSSCSQ
ncbi:hypothetical protein KIW84_062808 [Lathyrus oleraceus]|uniref:Retrovirus-related Pol polyprotein from transposon TNT 1-94-like beta-barrel domain-containing protein n=1 Tax=Pisum sativum TaxID=3888 RepID=A0A9D4W627_PEA|nr:hypothetical protein KIW84_062808 [Pisum sativum]